MALVGSVSQAFSHVYHVEEQMEQELTLIQLLESEGHPQAEARKQLAQRKFSFDPYRGADVFFYYLDQQAIAQMYRCSVEIIGVNRTGSIGNEVDTFIPDLRDSIMPGRERVIEPIPLFLTIETDAFLSRFLAPF